MPTATDYQALIIASLSSAEPDALEKLTASVPKYWRLHARVPYPELRYWYVRRDAIRVCMACNTQQIDYARRAQNSRRTSVDSARQDSLAAGAGLDDSAALSDRTASSVYDSAGDSAGSGSSAASRTSSQTSASASAYDDTGAGTSSQNRVMHQDTYTSDEGDVKRETAGQYDLRHRRGKDAGDGTTRGLNVYQYPGWEVDINPFDGTVLPSNTATTTTQMDSFTRSQVSEHVYSGYGSQGSIAEPFRESDTIVTITRTPRRTADTEMYDRPVADAGSPTPSMSSTFTAHVVSSDSASASASSSGSNQSASQLDSSAAGAGASTSSGTSSSSLTASSERTAHGEGETARSMQGASQADSLMEKLHQRFLHLQSLWEQANETIQWLEAQRLALPAYVVRALTIQYPDGLSAQVANAYLITPPGGR